MERVCGMIQPLARSKVWSDESISNGLIYEMYLRMAPFCRSSLSFEDIMMQPNFHDNDVNLEGIDDLSATTEDDEEDNVSTGIPEDPDELLGTDFDKDADQLIEMEQIVMALGVKEAVYSTDFGILRYSSIKQLDKTHLRKLRQYYRTLYSPNHSHHDPVLGFGTQFDIFLMRDNGDVVGSIHGLKRNDKVRNNSLIRYSMISDDSGTTKQYYGQVHFYLLHRFKGIDHCLAFVEYFPVKGYGRLEAGYITRPSRPSDDRS